RRRDPVRQAYGHRPPAPETGRSDGGGRDRAPGPCVVQPSLSGGDLPSRPASDALRAGESAERAVDAPADGKSGLRDPGGASRGRTMAHRRFAFEDFFLLELALGQKRESVKREARSLAYNLETPLPRRFLASLPFRLTEAQLRVLQDIHRDLASPHPMNRLIQ